MNRREFVAGVGAIAAGAMVARVATGAQPPAAPAADPAAAKPTPKRTLKRAAMLGMLAEGDSIQDKFQILRDLGYDGVEIDRPGRTPLDEYAAAQDKTGLKVHGIVDSIHWSSPLNNPVPEIRAKGLAALESCLRDAKQLGAVSVLLVPAVVNADLPYADAWKLSHEQIRKALPLAQEAGVKIAVENVWNNFLLSPLEAVRYLDDLNSPLAAWHFDIGNVINFGWPEQWIRVLGPRTAKLHIKDFSRKKRDDLGLWKGFDVELGDGDAGWPRVMGALDETGYSTAPQGNWATAEVRGGKRDRLKQVLEQMDKLFAM